MPDPETRDGQVACCVCGANKARLWRLAPDNLRGGNTRYRAVRCVRCRTVRLDPRPCVPMHQLYAPGTYARAENETDDAVGKRLDLFNARLAGRADRAARPSGAGSGRVLDVGCGDGRFLAAMAARGWAVEGLETDPVAAQLARRRTQAAIHETFLETANVPAAGFDLVTLLHVLEHVPDPRVTLGACRRVLRPGGALLVALPNVDSVEARLFGSAWYHLDLPRHWWGFTPHTLVRLVEECGFVVHGVRFLPFLFVLQSGRNALQRSRHPATALTRSARRGDTGRLQTRLFGALLHLSERWGRKLPGEIMEITAKSTA